MLIGDFDGNGSDDLMYWGNGGWRVFESKIYSEGIGWNQEVIFGRLDSRGYSTMNNAPVNYTPPTTVEPYPRSGFHVIYDYDHNGADDLIYLSDETGTTAWRILLSNKAGWRADFLMGDTFYF